MKLHPVIFILITYGLTAVIALGVYGIIKLIALSVHRKEKAPAPSAESGSKGGATA